MKYSKATTAGVLFLLLVLITGSSAAISVRPLNLEEMVFSADRIFLGRVVGSSSGYDSRISADVTIYTLVILEGIKGVLNGDSFQIRQVGRLDGGPSPVIGLPVYKKGEEVILFLHGNSRFGLTSPVGLSQGVFHTVLSRDGSKGYLNAVGNRNLRLESYTKFRSAPRIASEFRDESPEGSIPISLETLKSCIEEARQRGRVRK